MSKSLNNIINKYYSPKSFDDLDTWLKDLKAKANPETKILLIANKLDLEDSRIINKEDGKQIQEDFELDFFTETSVINENKAQEVFIESAKLLYNEYSKTRKDQSKNKDCLIY